MALSPQTLMPTYPQTRFGGLPHLYVWGYPQMWVCGNVSYMSTTIGIVQSKGGVGKTTTAIYLGLALKGHGTVEVWDADPQGSATEWSDATAAAGYPLPFPVTAVNEPQLSKKDSEASYLIIDTGPGNPRVMDKTIERADVVIIPTKSSSVDMARTWSTLDALPEDQPAILLMTQTDPRTITHRQTIEAIDQDGAAYFQTPIKHKESIKGSGNGYPIDLAGYEEVATELIERIKEMS
jgi:chromosome partitioning protein